MIVHKAENWPDSKDHWLKFSRLIDHSNECNQTKDRKSWSELACCHACSSKKPGRRVHDDGGGGGSENVGKKNEFAFFQT